MKLFLQGERRLGKSYMLAQALAPYAAGLAGFCVQRLWEGDSVAGYRAELLAGSIPPQDAAYSPGLAGVFLYRGQKDAQVLDGVAREAAQQAAAPHIKALLLDEIGGMELESPLFRTALYAMLNCGKPVLGVLKSTANLHSMAARNHFTTPCTAEHERLAGVLRTGGRLITLTAKNRAAVERELAGFVSRYIGGETI